MSGFYPMAASQFDLAQTHSAPKSTASNLLNGRRVLMILNADAGGGVEQLASTLRSYIEGQGATVETYCLYSEASIGWRAKLRGVVEAAKTVLSRKPDVLMTFQPTSSVVAMTMGWLAGCRNRIVHQSNLPSGTARLPRILDRFAGTIGLYSAIIMNSHATRQAFEGYPASYVRRLRLIEHGVPYYPPQIERETARRKLGVSADSSVIIAVARLSPGKSLDTIVSALTSLHGTDLVIAGDGECRDSLQQLSERLGLANRVHLLGFVQPAELASLYSAADLFASPSKSETFGMAVVEAAMHGVPVVASSIPASREVLTLEDGSPALFVNDWETKSWIRDLQRGLDDVEITVRAKAFAPKFIDWYSIDRMLAKYGDLFRETLT